jgi:hypothetical protein
MSHPEFFTIIFDVQKCCFHSFLSKKLLVD